MDISLGELSEWAVASRYPGEWEEPTESDAEAALYAATGVVEAMTKDLRARGLG